jgi:MFS family permease
MPMSPAVRRAIYVVCALLWGSGCAWLVVHFFFPTASDFGPAPSPWEPVFLRLHGWVAVSGVFLLGWITAGHISDRWRRSRSRVTGFSLAGFALVLVLSGYALYYTTDYFHDVAAVVHEALGVGAIIMGLLHWTRSSSNPEEVRRL